MFRYRCPHCSQVLQAPEIRAGKTTVCSKCSQPLTIPADKAQWLNERGEPLLTSPTVVIPTTPPPAEPRSARPEPAADDVLGAIFVGAVRPPERYEDIPLDVVGPKPSDLPAPKAIVPQDTPPEGIHPSRTPSGPELEPILTPPLGPNPRKAARSEPRPVPTPEPRHGPTPPPHQPAAAEDDTLARPTRPPEPAPHRPAPTPAPATRPAVNGDLAGPPAPVGVADEDQDWAANPAPQRPRRVVAATPAPPRQPGEETGRVSFGEPLQLRSQIDFAVDLTAALTTRMRPPPKPPRDLDPSTAVWILLTGGAVVLLALALLTSRDLLPVVAYLGAAQVLAGYLWVVWLAFRRDRERGLLCAVPPLTFWYLTRWKYAKYRPLRFVATGAALLALAAAGSYVQPRTRAWVGAGDGQPPAPAPDIKTQSKLAQLRYYRDQRAYDALVEVLRTLPATDPGYSSEKKDRAEIAAELKALCKHPDSGVRVEAMTAYALWGGDDAREVCLAAVRSPNQDERMAALRLLPRWKDENVARAIAARIGGRVTPETIAAREALAEIGGPVAEQAAIPLLLQEDQGVRLTAIQLLGRKNVGGPAAVAALLELARTTPDPGTRRQAEEKAREIEARLGEKK